MDGLKDSLLSQAINNFKKITDGAYTEIIPSDNLEKPDFKPKAATDDRFVSSDILSRGTREQLFLAMRLSRIKEIKPSLPVILDDTLVNFDIGHLQRTMEIIKQLANTNQIFVLTCHPHVVDYLHQRAENAQYWRLENGNFYSTTGDTLVEYLSLPSTC